MEQSKIIDMLETYHGFIPFGLGLIFLFFKTLKQGKKQELALGSGSIGYSQK